MLVDDVDENGLGRLLAVIGVRRCAAAAKAGGWEEAIFGRISHHPFGPTMRYVSAPGNLLRFASVVENNNFPEMRNKKIYILRPDPISSLYVPFQMNPDSNKKRIRNQQRFRTKSF